MKKTFLFLLILFFVGCNDDDGPCIVGSGNLTTYDDISVAPFQAVSVSGKINVNITQGPVQDVVIRAEPEIFDRLVYEVNNGLLEVYFRRGECFTTDLGVQLDITVPDLTLITISGQSEVRTLNNVEFDELAIDISGDGDVEMNGYIRDFLIRCSGLLEARNFDLTTDIQTLNISGQAYVELDCQIELGIIVSGAAEIRYRGNPQISQNVSGSLQLTDAN